MIKPITKKTLIFINVIFKISFTKSDIKSCSIQYIRDVTRGIRNFEFDIIQLGFTGNDLVKLYSTDVIFRSKKKFVKSVIENLLVNPFLLIILLTPFWLPYFFMDVKLGFFSYVGNYLISFFLAIVLGYVILNGFKFIQNFEVKIGKALTKMVQLLLLLSICSLVYFLIEFENSLIKVGVVSAYFVVYITILARIFEYIFAEILVDIFYFSKKIQITDALIIESAYRLSKSNWAIIIKKRNLRQKTLLEIERLAGLIENDWSSHIIPGDEKTNSWKIKTLKGIAAGLRNLKREIIIPSAETPQYLQTTFDSIFEKILNHDIKGLIGAEVPAIRIKKKSKLKALQSLIVAIIPISIALALKNYPIIEIPENYLHIGIVIGGLWLLISLLLWLDPNLADKINTVKSFRSVMKGSQSE